MPNETGPFDTVVGKKVFFIYPNSVIQAEMVSEEAGDLQFRDVAFALRGVGHQNSSSSSQGRVRGGDSSDRG